MSEPGDLDRDKILQHFHKETIEMQKECASRLEAVREELTATAEQREWAEMRLGVLTKIDMVGRPAPGFNERSLERMELGTLRDQLTERLNDMQKQETKLLEASDKLTNSLKDQARIRQLLVEEQKLSNKLSLGL